MLTGRSAFSGIDLNGILKRSDRPPPPVEHRSPSCRTRSTTSAGRRGRGPNERYQDAGRDGAATSRLRQAGQNTRARRCCPGSSARPARRRNPPWRFRCCRAPSPSRRRRHFRRGGSARSSGPRPGRRFGRRDRGLIAPNLRSGTTTTAPVVAKAGIARRLQRQTATAAPAASPIAAAASAAASPSPAVAPLLANSPATLRRRVPRPATPSMAPASTAAPVAAAASRPRPHRLPLRRPRRQAHRARADRRRPWGGVLVDGKQRGLSPLLRNCACPRANTAVPRSATERSPRTSRTIEVRADEVVNLAHKF